MSKKENIKKLIDVIMENRSEIVEMSKSCYKASMDGDHWQGWNVGVIINTDGELSDFYRSQGSSSMEEYNGEAIAVINYTIDGELGDVMYSKEYLTDEEFKNFSEWLLREEYIENLDQAENEVNYKYLDEFDSNIVKRIDEEYMEWCVDEYYQESASEKIDQILENLKNELDNIEMYDEE
jgi:hypothetical protein